MTNCHSHISKTHWTQSYWIPNALHLVWVIGDPSIHGLPFSPRPKAWTALKGSASLISVAVKVAWSSGEARSKKISQKVPWENDDWTLYSDVDFSRLWTSCLQFLLWICREPYQRMLHRLVVTLTLLWVSNGSPQGPPPPPGKIMKTFIKTIKVFKIFASLMACLWWSGGLVQHHLLSNIWSHVIVRDLCWYTFSTHGMCNGQRAKCIITNITCDDQGLVLVAWQALKLLCLPLLCQDHHPPQHH